MDPMSSVKMLLHVVLPNWEQVAPRCYVDVAFALTQTVVHSCKLLSWCCCIKAHR